MSVIPKFELGIWNAWILVLPFLVLDIFGYTILRKRGAEGFLGLTKKEKMLESITMVIVGGLYAYSIFLPLRLDIVWFYGGFFLYLLGMAFVLITFHNFITTPVDSPVTKGLYRISRNPQYLSEFLIYVSIGIACFSWVFWLVAVIVHIFERRFVTAEERICLHQYGEPYRDYMNKTPRWIGIPKTQEKD